MFNLLINNALTAKKAGSTLREKFDIFNRLNFIVVKNKLHKKQDECILEIPNFRVAGFDYDSLNFLYREIFLSKEYYFVPTGTAPVIVDCGANIGMSVLYFKNLFPKASILAFEANPRVFPLLQKNIERNHLTQVELHNIALYDHETTLSFFVGDETKTVLGSIRKERGGEIELKVNAAKLSNYIKNYKKIDLIKIDVEGAEWQIIRDLDVSGTLKLSDQYIIEFHHNINDEPSNLSAFLKFFESNGFNYNLKSNFEGLKGFQDMLIHCYKK